MVPAQRVLACVSTIFAFSACLACRQSSAPPSARVDSEPAAPGEILPSTTAPPSAGGELPRARWEFDPRACELAYARDGWLVWRRSEIFNNRGQHAPPYRTVCWRQRWGESASHEVYDEVSRAHPHVGGVLPDGTVMLVLGPTALWVRPGEKSIETRLATSGSSPTWDVVRFADTDGVVLQQYFVSPPTPERPATPTFWIPWRNRELDHADRIEIAPAGELSTDNHVEFFHAGRHLLWGKWVYDLGARTRRELPLPPDKVRYALCDGEVVVYHGPGGSGTYAVTLAGERLPVNGNWVALAIRDGLLYGAIGRDPTRIVAVNLCSGIEREVVELRLTDFPEKCAALETPERLEIWNDGKWSGVPWLAPADRP